MIKAILFDFDSTLFIGDVGADYFDYEKAGILSIVKDEKKYDDLVKRRAINKTNSPMKTALICKEEGYDADKLLKYYNDVIYQHSPSDVFVLPNAVLQALSKKYQLYIVSMSAQSYLKHYLAKYGLDLGLFSEVISVCNPDELDKGARYQDIITKHGFLPEELLMVGDNLAIDILPAKKLGMNVLHFQGDFNQMYNYFTENNILDCTEYLNTCNKTHS